MNTIISNAIISLEIGFNGTGSSCVIYIYFTGSKIHTYVKTVYVLSTESLKTLKVCKYR